MAAKTEATGVMETTGHESARGESVPEWAAKELIGVSTLRAMVALARAARQSPPSSRSEETAPRPS